ncbi:MAG: H(+)/Cl(-) exchange transporter ClcA [Burkholderiales bacterium]
MEPSPRSAVPAAAEEEAPACGALLRLAGTALAAGLLTGLVGTAFRAVLLEADHFRGVLVAWARQWPGIGWLIPVLIAAVLVALARWMVKRYAPVAGGSGVQHVEAVMRGEAEPAPAAVLPVKFVGGALAIGSGLALGREGPTVQMGATIGAALGQRGAPADVRTLQSAAAGAGLAVAFNAPFGGAVFVFEELSRHFTLRLMVATLTACAGGVLVLRVLLGDPVEFAIGGLYDAPFWAFGLYLAFGATLGVLGAAYNHATLRGLDLFARFPAVPVEARAAAIGALVGLVAWFEPAVVGGGETLVQDVLSGQFTWLGLALIFAVRWVLGPLSYAAGTPGGLFSPLLLVGAAFGALFGGVAHALLPALVPQPMMFAVAGMASFFTAVVRAPLTGLILVVEMTATTAAIVPMLAACAGALIVPALLGSPPIYDTLRERMLRANRS